MNEPPDKKNAHPGEPERASFGKRLESKHQSPGPQARSGPAYQPLNVKQLGNVPAELQSGKCFVCWREAVRSGKRTKIPVNPLTGSDAESDNPATWGTLKVAVAYYQAHLDKLQGIGRMFRADEEIIGVDFDECLDDRGSVIPGSPAAEWLPRLNSYTEVSPSGRGCKVWLHGRHELGGKTGRRDAKQGVEIYRTGRYFTLTGRWLAEFSGKVESRQREIEDFCNEFFPAKTTGSRHTSNSTTIAATDIEIIERASRAGNGAKFVRLWEGNWGDDFGSQSEADAALCAILWFWTGDRGTVRRLFGESELGQRAKWRDRADYQATTLDLACKGEICANLKTTNPDVVGPVSSWFAAKFPQLPDEFGTAVLEETDNDGRQVVRDLSQPFLAATLGEQGSPENPTVFIPAENRFWTYMPCDGVFVEARDALLLTRLSRLLLEAARASRGAVTKKLEFGFRDSASLSGIVKHAQGLLAKPHDYFDGGRTEFIPCLNGMLRLSDKELLAFSPSYRRRNKLGVAFDPSARCPLFMDTLMRPALSAEELDLLQRWCGLALIGENIAQRILVISGTAGGGKGTFIRVLTGIIGANNVGALRTHLLGERFELGRLLGKSLLYGADVSDDFLNHRGASRLKALTGGDPVTLEFKNSNEAPGIVCKFNIVVTCNSRLTVHLEGDTEAWRRRLAIIEYRNTKPDKLIADLSEQILAREASGVLNWMLAGLEKIRADGWRLHLTPAQQKTVDDLLLESESQTVFVSENLVRDAQAQLTVADCYAAYVEFCNGRGWRAVTRNKFGAAIGDTIVHTFGVTMRHDVSGGDGKPQRGWKGIRLQ